MSKINELLLLIKHNEKLLDASYEIRDANAGNLLLICDNDTEYGEQYYMLETENVLEAYDYLINNEMFQRVSN